MGSVHFEKLIVARLVKNPPPPSFYGTLSFITVFTKSYHWSLSWSRRRSVHSYLLFV